ncbi:MAG: CHAT domain-containing protein [Saprospiraceae bacterium]
MVRLHTSSRFNPGFQDLYATSLLNKGFLHSLQFDFTQAIRYQQQALLLTQKVNEQILGYNHLARYYYAIGKTQQALQQIAVARSLTHQNSHRQNHSLTELTACELLYETGNYTAFQQTLDDLLRYLPPNDPNLVADRMKALNWLATRYIDEAHFEEAIHICYEVLNLGKDKQYTDIIIKTYQLLAQALQHLGCYEDGLFQIQQALTLSTPGFKAVHITDNPKVAQIQLMDFAVLMFTSKLELLLKAWESENKQAYLTQALNVYRTTDSLILDKRRFLKSTSSRTALTQAAQQFHHLSMSLFYTLYTTTEDEQWIDEAFRCMERNRSLIISEQLSHQYAMQEVIPSHLRQQEQDLIRRSAYLQMLIQHNGKNDTTIVRQWQQELRKVEHAWNQLLSDFERRFPVYHQQKYDLPFVLPQEVQRELITANEAVISYTETDTVVFAIAINQKSIRFDRLQLRQPLHHTLAKMQTALLGRKSVFYEIAHDIYIELLAPLSPIWQGNDLIIIPEGQLWEIPFAALPVAKEQRKNAKQQPFLIRNTNLRYWYAAHAAMLQHQRPTPPKPDYYWVGFSPFETAGQVYNNKTLAALPGTRNEIDHILDHGHQHPSTYIAWRKEEATRTQFFNYAHRTQVLHLSTHTISDPTNPAESVLFFAIDSTVLDTPSLLYLYEIQNQHWPALEMVVLSACDTQEGLLEGGEGMAGFARAFALSGCHNLVGSLWEVQDATAVPLMDAFYAHLAQKKGKNNAFCEAQRTYLTSDRELLMHPYFWAGFVHIGDNMPLHPVSPTPYWIWGSLLAIGGWMWYGRKSSK